MQAEMPPGEKPKDLFKKVRLNSPGRSLQALYGVFPPSVIELKGWCCGGFWFLFIHRLVPCGRTFLLKKRFLPRRLLDELVPNDFSFCLCCPCLLYLSIRLFTKRRLIKIKSATKRKWMHMRWKYNPEELRCSASPLFPRTTCSLLLLMRLEVSHILVPCFLHSSLLLLDLFSLANECLQKRNLVRYTFETWSNPQNYLHELSMSP